MKGNFFELPFFIFNQSSSVYYKYVEKRNY